MIHPPSAEQVQLDVERALLEDLGDGDVSAALLPDDPQQAHVLCREKAVIAGRPWFDACFVRLDPQMRIEWHVAEGERVEPGTVLCTLHGRARALVSGERAALNFLQTLSGTATVTASYADALASTRTRVLDTRKTLPGLRVAQKYAVRAGGGVNHRMGLYDAVMIKENHVIAAGSIGAAIAESRRLHPGVTMIVEVETLDELDEALAGAPDRILLDEFTKETLLEAVRRVEGRIPLEVSGSVTLDTIAEVAATGVDFVSVGALTKHVRAVDLSLRLGPAPGT
jgi:nicotinate-nucleotide pyrophosphorylase (carboxylating)